MNPQTGVKEKPNIAMPRGIRMPIIVPISAEVSFARDDNDAIRYQQINSSCFQTVLVKPSTPFEMSFCSESFS
jgi:hypothetical protein